MAKQTKTPPVSDPYLVPETLCEGPFNLQVRGAIALLTFTHVRPNAKSLIEDKKPEYETIVRARIVLSVSSLRALKKLLNDAIKDEMPKEPAPGGSPVH